MKSVLAFIIVVFVLVTLFSGTPVIASPTFQSPLPGGETVKLPPKCASGDVCSLLQGKEKSYEVSILPTPEVSILPTPIAQIVLLRRHHRLLRVR